MKEKIENSLLINSFNFTKTSLEKEKLTLLKEKQNQESIQQESL